MIVADRGRVESGLKRLAVAVESEVEEVRNGNGCIVFSCGNTAYCAMIFKSSYSLIFVSILEDDWYCFVLHMIDHTN